MRCQGKHAGRHLLGGLQDSGWGCRVGVPRLHLAAAAAAALPHPWPLGTHSAKHRLEPSHAESGRGAGDSPALELAGCAVVLPRLHRQRQLLLRLQLQLQLCHDPGP